jgi:hypothetical protein
MLSLLYKPTRPITIWEIVKLESGRKNINEEA